eukprot:315521_1
MANTNDTNQTFDMATFPPVIPDLDHILRDMRNQQQPANGTPANGTAADITVTPTAETTASAPTAECDAVILCQQVNAHHKEFIFSKSEMGRIKQSGLKAEDIKQSGSKQSGLKPEDIKQSRAKCVQDTVIFNVDKYWF